MRILFITTSDIQNMSYGGGKGAKGRYELLKQFGRVDACQILKKSNIASVVSLAQGHYPPLRDDIIKKILYKCRKNRYDMIYMDTSVCGTLVRKLKKRYAGIPILSHFQNCESDFNAIRFAGGNAVQSFFYHKLVQNEERLTLKYSDCCAVLSKRDSSRLQDLYGREPDRMLPLFIKDEASEADFITKATEGYCLLFGPALYPNVEGFSWFADHVSPYIHIKTLIAGKGFEQYKDKLNGKSVSVAGYVEDIHQLYRNAVCVCIPLFRGCGMKVKTAEALMFGKTVFGTDEAFSGYEFDYKKAGGICNHPEDYISKINLYIDSGQSFYNSDSRKIYLERYSESSAVKRYKRVLDSLCGKGNKNK